MPFSVPDVIPARFTVDRDRSERSAATPTKVGDFFRIHQQLNRAELAKALQFCVGPIPPLAHVPGGSLPGFYFDVLIAGAFDAPGDQWLGVCAVTRLIFDREHQRHAGRRTIVWIPLVLLLPVRALFATPADQAPPLPAPTGTIVHVSTEAELQTAVQSAVSDSTIVIGVGTYHLSSTLDLAHVTNVTLRGATNDSNDVVLVGKGMSNANYGAVRDGISTNGQRITIANLTIRDVYRHAIALNPGAERPRIHNVRLVNAGEQFIKADPDGAGGGVDGGIVEYSRIEYSTTGRDSYPNGVEVQAGVGWIVRHTLFLNLQAPAGFLAGPAVLIWNSSRDSIVEGNTFINCQREIALGLVPRSPNDHTAGIVRNNIMYRKPGLYADVAIQVADSPNTQVLHNTILVNGTYSYPIEYRFSDSTGVVIRNNLLDGQTWARDGATGTASSNYRSATASMFMNAAAGDLHLAPTATSVIDRVAPVANITTDWDGDTRPQGTAADYGADEVSQAAVPLPWFATDIGSPAAAGSSSHSWGTFTVKGAGTNIWGGGDQFQFVYQPLTGDGEMVVRVESFQSSDWGKAGLMIRESLTTGSRNAFVHIVQGHGLAFSYRAVTDGTTTRTYGPDVVAPYWLRLVRTGSTIRAYSSSNGASWALMGSAIVSIGNTVYAGLAVTSRESSTLATATFTNVAVTAGSSNQSPSVTLTAPASGASYTAPASITLSASASDPDGAVASVRFYAGSSLLATDTGSPYSFNWSNVAAGSYTLTAVATDTAGATKTSSAVSVTVTTTAVVPRNLLFNASPDHATNVTSYTLKIFIAGVNPLVATPVTSKNLGKPAVVSGEIAVDIGSLILALPPGSYFGTVTAIGPGGSTQSTPSNTFTR